MTWHARGAETWGSRGLVDLRRRAVFVGHCSVQYCRTYQTRGVECLRAEQLSRAGLLAIPILKLALGGGASGSVVSTSSAPAVVLLQGSRVRIPHTGVLVGIT
jgi:hypothetical protein